MSTLAQEADSYLRKPVSYEEFRHGSELALRGRKHLYKFGWAFGCQAGEQNTCSETQAMV
jgi:hypothetical protein